MIYEIGDIARLTANFTDLNGNPAAPTTVALTITDPSGNPVTPGSIITDFTGQYHYDLTVTLSGIYTYRWTGAGTITAVQEGSLTVAIPILDGPNPAAINLCTLDQVKDWLLVNSPTTVIGNPTGNDLLLSRLITFASAAFLHWTGRGPADGTDPFSSPFVTPCSYNENYDGNGNDRLFLRNSPITAVASATANGITLTQSSGFPNPGYLIDTGAKCLVMVGYSAAQAGAGWGWSGSRGLGHNWGWPRGTANINVQYTAGFAATPFDVNEAITEVVGMTYKRRPHIDVNSLALSGGGGTTSYSRLVIPDMARKTIEYYLRRSI